MHLLIGVAGGRICDHRDLVAQLSAVADSCLQASMCDESHHDELMDAMLLEEKIQIGVGETTGTPMLLGDDVARLGFKPGGDLATPHSVFNGLA